MWHFFGVEWRETRHLTPVLLHGWQIVTYEVTSRSSGRFVPRQILAAPTIISGMAIKLRTSNSVHRHRQPRDGILPPAPSRLTFDANNMSGRFVNKWNKPRQRAGNRLSIVGFLVLLLGGGGRIAPQLSFPVIAQFDVPRRRRRSPVITRRRRRRRRRLVTSFLLSGFGFQLPHHFVEEVNSVRRRAAGTHRRLVIAAAVVRSPAGRLDRRRRHDSVVAVALLHLCRRRRRRRRRRRGAELARVGVDVVRRLQRRAVHLERLRLVVDDFRRHDDRSASARSARARESEMPPPDYRSIDRSMERVRFSHVFDVT